MPPVAPMLAKPAAAIPLGQFYEPKWDGFRSVVFRDGDEVEIGSRARRVGYETPEELGALFARCGLADVATGELLVHADYESFDDLWRPFTAGVGHSGGCLASLDRDGQAALAANAYRRLGSPDGSFELTARAWWARGTAP